MGKLPDKLIIIRHGARLDETLDDARLNTFREMEHGYDSPLTYKGWRQSQALGQYLARLILYPGNPNRTRKKIIIHSSPFTRCLQTSIGIASGFGEVAPSSGDDDGLDHESDEMDEAHHLMAEHPILSVGAHMEALLANSLSKLRDPELIVKDIERNYSASEVSTYHKIQLRIEPFLREWLSDTYFQERHDEYLKPCAMVNRAAQVMLNKKAADGVAAPKAADHFDPHALDFTRDIYHESGLFLREHEELVAHDALDTSAPPFKADGTYNSPVPDYAIRPSDQIPRGYVAHARDACVHLDRTWIGVGVNRGYFPETWHSFHARIEGGFNALLKWYANHAAYQSETDNEAVGDDGDFTDLYQKFGSIDGSAETEEDLWMESTKRTSVNSTNSQAEQEEMDEELVVIIVTHAAGCNKMLNVLTQRPVLIDFPHACLTLAIKNSEMNDETVPSDLYRVIVRGSIQYMTPTVSSKTIEDYMAQPQAAKLVTKEPGRSSRRTTLSGITTTASAAPGTRMWGQRGSADIARTEPQSAIENIPPSLWKPGRPIQRRSTAQQ